MTYICLFLKLESAILAVPLETDANEELILAEVKENLKVFGNHSEAEIEQFIYQPHVVYEKHFNSGESPVWLTYVYDGDRLLCKQINGYDRAFHQNEGTRKIPRRNGL